MFSVHSFICLPIFSINFIYCQLTASHIDVWLIKWSWPRYDFHIFILILGEWWSPLPMDAAAAAYCNQWLYSFGCEKLDLIRQQTTDEKNTELSLEFCISVMGPRRQSTRKKPKIVVDTHENRQKKNINEIFPSRIIALSDRKNQPLPLPCLDPGTTSTHTLYVVQHASLGMKSHHRRKCLRNMNYVQS